MKIKEGVQETMIKFLLKQQLIKWVEEKKHNYYNIEILRIKNIFLVN